MKPYSSVDSNLIREIILPRSKLSRKGENGITLIVGGSRIYHGAPLLSSIAALRSGTDLVYTAIPKINLSSSRNFSADLIFLPFPDDKLTSGSVRRLLNSIPKKIDAAGIGMGLSFSKPSFLLTLINGLTQQDVRLLIDAGALIPEILKEIINTETVITPHAGEFKRLFGQLPTTDLNEQIKLVTKMAKEYGLIITLKGFWNIVSDGEKVYVIQRTTPSMTVGGTGDILSGLVAGYLTKYEPVHACILGLYFNGIAGLNLYGKVGLHMTASDLLSELPVVMKDYDVISD
jgi:ADP-dependent NAD(P)H-hydrate dehydratase